MEKKILITSDSTTDLSPELREKYNIKILPLGVTLGDEVFQDGVNVNADMLYDYYEKTGKLPKTSAVNIAEASDFFEQYVNEGYTIIHFTISSEMSNTYQNCCIAAENFDNVHIVDGHNLSTGGGLVVLTAAEMAQKGATVEEIIEKVNEVIPCVDASFVIDNLEYLYKGGRCSAVSALGANLLKLKPCIHVANGKMSVGKKYRGKYKDTLIEYVKEHLGDASDVKLDKIFITHAGCDQDIIDTVKAQVESQANFENIYITRASCTISSHCGRNTLGILFIRNSPIV